MHLAISNLIKEYEGNRVLDVETIAIPKYSLCGIIGPNGAGKSTIVKIIAGLEKPTSGKIEYDGEPFTENIFKNITMVFQKPYLLRTSVFNNIAYPLIIRKERKEDIKEKVYGIIEEMGIEKIKNQSAWTLSGGETQKVALARALVFQPTLIILDEPTANIDPVSVMAMEETIGKVHERKQSTVLIVTHNIHQAKRICDKIVFMNKGKVEEYGKAEDIIHRAKNKQTQKFIMGELLI
jgi:tungstate transport system ATP-binding protein